MELQIIFNVVYFIGLALWSFIALKIKTANLEQQLKELEKFCKHKEALMGDMHIELAKVKTKALSELEARKIFVTKNEFEAHLKRLDEMDKTLREKLDLIIEMLKEGRF